MQSSTQTAAIGHNNPPSEIEILKDKLKEKHEPILTHARDLISMAKNTLNIKITDDETNGIYSDLIKDITAQNKKLESTRVAEIEPHLSTQRTIQAFFKLPMETLENTVRALKQPVTQYLQEKEAAARRRLAAEAEAKRKEAAAQLEAAVELEKQDLNKASDNALVKSQVNTKEAVKLEVQSQAKPAALSRTRGESSMATVKTVWKGKINSIDDLDLERLRSFINPEALEKAVSNYVRAGNRELKGATIYEEAETVIR